RPAPPRPGTVGGRMLVSLRARAARIPHRAVGALAGQVTLALGNFVLAIVAARELGPTGLGAYALMFGVIVMATAATTGLLGDSLTVLDRRDPPIRASLSRIALGLTAALAVTAFVVARATLAPTT